MNEPTRDRTPDDDVTRPDMIAHDEIATDPAADLEDLTDRDTGLDAEEIDPNTEADPYDVLEQRREVPVDDDDEAPRG
ncbi:hypothetical protein LWC35_34195 [Pseudonocardia kujensis]|uniref:hypothetical protein n=1 Tax=Pseudonocardia kujensis TaxID=1128675 RepID=UPI001E5E2DF0|nr:hypothetical protein [Pseudonocardia kujensis]MCE0767916.1 hypothetical protein [Pseudonocardia kujensis]